MSEFLPTIESIKTFLKIIREEFLYKKKLDKYDIKSSLNRYENFWLPLVQKVESDLEPPDDVRLIWFCHLLDSWGNEHNETTRYSYAYK